MKKEDLVAMGLTDEQADKVIAKFGSMIPKVRFDEVNDAKKELEKQIGERDTQLTDLKKQVKDNTELTNQIQQLQDANKQSTADFEQKLKDTQLNSAIKLALAGKVQDADIVATLLDKTKVELNEDGSLKGGLDDQIKSLKEAKPFLFVEEKANSFEFKGFVPAASDGDGGNGSVSVGASFAQKLNGPNQTSNEQKSIW